MKLDDKILQIIPLFAPVPTAWMIGVSTVEKMHFPEPVAVITALTVEGLGFVSINTANEMREFNRHLNGVELKQKMQAPTWQAYGVAGLYLATATMMTVVLHISPALTTYAPLPFIVMTAAGGWLFALRKEHADRVEKWQAGRAQATLKRRSAKPTDAVSDAGAKSATLTDAGNDAQRRSATKSAKIYRCECKFETDNRYIFSGHCRTCATHQIAKVQGQAIPVNIPEKVQP